MIEGLRPYQQEAVSAAVRGLREHRSVLIVMPTGTGKTQVFVALASMARRGRVLMLAHRDELVGQAAARVEQMLGIIPGREKAATHSNGEQIVVGSVQTLRLRRLERVFRPDDFSLVVVDEAHHAAARSYRTILDYLSGARVIGVTATPDRTDRQAMGEVFDAVAYEYGIEQALGDGWLVPPTLDRITLEGLDLSS